MVQNLDAAIDIIKTFIYFFYRHGHISTVHIYVNINDYIFALIGIIAKMC